MFFINDCEIIINAHHKLIFQIDLYSYTDAGVDGKCHII